MSTATQEITGFENAKFELKAIPLDKIKLGSYALREANRNSEDYQRLRDAIAATNGPMLPILVREIDDPDNKGKTIYGLIDGLQRYSCCTDLGFKAIPARVIDMDEAQIASAQIIANHSRIETKPVEYTTQLRRMLNANPTLTLEELSDQLHCSIKWLKDRLSLANLHEKIGPLVDGGQISLANAFALAKLQPEEEQLAFVEQAQTQGIQEFVGHVTNHIKALRAAVRTGRAPSPDEFTPVAHMRTIKEIKTQLEAPTLASLICSKVEAKTPEEGFSAAISWVLSMDPDTIELQRQAALDRKAKAADEKKKKAEEKIKKKAEEARKAAKAAGIDVDATTDEDEDEGDA